MSNGPTRNHATSPYVLAVCRRKPRASRRKVRTPRRNPSCGPGGRASARGSVFTTVPCSPSAAWRGLLSLGPGPSEEPPHDRSHQQDSDHDADRPEVLLDRSPPTPQGVPHPGQGECPRQAPRERVRSELTDGHLGHARRQADERSDHREQTGHEHGRLAVLGEPLFCPTEFVLTEEDVPSPPLHEWTTSPPSPPVGEQRADQVSERSYQADHDEVQLVRMPREAGCKGGIGGSPAEQHGDLAGDGNTGRFEDHEDEHGQIAEVLDRGPNQVLHQGRSVSAGPWLRRFLPETVFMLPPNAPIPCYEARCGHAVQ